MIWKEIPEFSKYEASNTGLVRNKITKELIHQRYSFNNPENYYSVRVVDDNGNKRLMYTHRLIAAAFFGVKSSSLSNRDYVIDHIDSDKHNNNINNLEWVKHAENMVRAMKNGLRDDNIEVTVYDKETDTETTYYSIIELSRKMNIHRGKLYGYLYLYSKDILYRNRYKFTYNKNKLFAVVRKRSPCYVYDLLNKKWNKYRSHTEVSLNTGISASVVRFKLRYNNTNQYCGYIISKNKNIRIPKYDIEFLKEERDNIYTMGREYKPKYLITNTLNNQTRIIETIKQCYAVLGIPVSTECPGYYDLYCAIRKHKPNITIEKIMTR